MVKQNSSPLHLEQHWTDHPAIQWTILNGRQLAYAALALLLLLIIGYRLLSSQSSQAERDYIQAITNLSLLNTPEKREAALVDLQQIVTRHPELQAKYDGIIGQELLIDNRIDEAKIYIDRTFQRVENETPANFIAYAKNSLLVTQGDFTQALQNAYALKGKMLNEAKVAPSQDALLYVFNTIRIALIEKELKHTDGEQAAWTELKDMSTGIHPIKITQSELQRVMSHFNNQSAQLEAIQSK